jgi:hypothetical protein
VGGTAVDEPDDSGTGAGNNGAGGQ